MTVYLFNGAETFCSPDKIAALQKYAALAALQKYAALAAPTCVIVEIGTWHGGSAVALAAAAKCGVYTIDPQVGADLARVREVIHSSGLSDRLAAITGFSEQVARTWLHAVGLLFVDGDHQYASTRGDLEAWLPHVAPGGYVVLDDLDAPTVRSAVDDWLAAGGSERMVEVERVENLAVYQVGGADGH